MDKGFDRKSRITAAAAPIIVEAPRKRNAKLRLNLKMIASVDFRCGVPYHYGELRRTKKLQPLGDDETLLLVSQTGFSLAFVFREMQIHRRGDVNLDVINAIASYRIQLDKKTPWSPLMLSEYANAANIELIGVTKFAEHLRGIADEK